MAVAANHKVGVQDGRLAVSRLTAQASIMQEAPAISLRDTNWVSIAPHRIDETNARSAARSRIVNLRFLKVRVKAATPAVTSRWIAAEDGATGTEGLLTEWPRKISRSEFNMAATMMPGNIFFQYSAVTIMITAAIVRKQ